MIIPGMINYIKWYRQVNHNKKCCELQIFFWRCEFFLVLHAKCIAVRSLEQTTPVGTCGGFYSICFFWLWIAPWKWLTRHCVCPRILSSIHHQRARRFNNIFIQLTRAFGVPQTQLQAPDVRILLALPVWSFLAYLKCAREEKEGSSNSSIEVCR